MKYEQGAGTTAAGKDLAKQFEKKLTLAQIDTSADHES